MEAIARLVHAADLTTPSQGPTLQTPLTLGADIVIHFATKYLAEKIFVREELAWLLKNKYLDLHVFFTMNSPDTSIQLCCCCCPLRWKGPKAIFG
jgi:hypothetical protein